MIIVIEIINVNGNHLKDPRYKRFRPGQTSNSNIKRWINNCDLHALVYEKKCRKCNI